MIRHQATNQHARLSAGGFAFYKNNLKKKSKSTEEREERLLIHETKTLIAYL